MKDYKIHWGIGILFFMLLFLATVAIRIILASGISYQKVSDDYYEVAVKHDNQMIKIANGNQFKSSIIVNQSNNIIEIIFPDYFKSKLKEGSFWVYFPSEITLDKKIAFIDTSNVYKVEIDPGSVNKKYYVKIEWATDSITYLVEKEKI